MKACLLLLPAVLFASLLAGCVDDPQTKPGSYSGISWCSPDDFQRPELERVEIDTAASPTKADGPAFDGVLDGTVSENPTACDCTDDSCMIDWIEENMGCGVCVTLTCSGSPMGGCLPCAEPTPAEPSRDSEDNSPCVLAPVETNPPGFDIQVQPSTDAEPAPSRLPEFHADAVLATTDSSALPVLHADAVLAQQ